jgi:GNAT superfamily N-acetyltransferase
MEAPAAPRDLKIRTVRAGKLLRDYHGVVALGFGMPIEIARALVSSNLLLDPESESFVGYVDDVPVATSTLILGGRVAGVFNVATHPEHRKRGYGEALTWRAIQRGAELGCDLAALQASDMGRPIYERMGFNLVSPYKTFHRPGI